MASTELKIGMASSTRPSSRVLKPPGGGHSNIFAEPEQSVNAPRPKYNQQNSSNLNACIGSTDPNIAIEKLREEVQHKKEVASESGKPENTKEAKDNNITSNGATSETNGNNATANKSRVPPGGFSSGSFW